MNAADFEGVVCPGGFMPDKLRRDPKVLDLVRAFHAKGQLVAAVCHGGWIPISAGVYKGVKVTGSPGIKDDLINAGRSGWTPPLLSTVTSSAAVSRTIFQTSAKGSSKSWRRRDRSAEPEMRRNRRDSASRAPAMTLRLAAGAMPMMGYRS